MRNDSQKISIEERLRAERFVREAPVGFTSRVMSEIERCDSAPSRPAWTALWLRVACGFAALVLAVFVVGRFVAEPESAVVAESSVVPAVERVEPVEINIPEIRAEQVQALTLKLDQPLEKELEYVISDTRQAIQFVAASFLPEK